MITELTNDTFSQRRTGYTKAYQKIADQIACHGPLSFDEVRYAGDGISARGAHTREAVSKGLIEEVIPVKLRETGIVDRFEVYDATIKGLEATYRFNYLSILDAKERKNLEEWEQVVEAESRWAFRFAEVKAREQYSKRWQQ